jgi:hypothetical protein
VVKSAARTITARIGAARPKPREAGEEKVAAISDPVSGDRLFRLFRLSCGAEARARGAVLRRPPKMEYTATMKVDATVVMVARRCARVVRERTGWGSVEASEECGSPLFESRFCVCPPFTVSEALHSPSPREGSSRRVFLGGEQRWRA